MADLKTDYKDDVLDTTQNTKRKYQMIDNGDGTVSFEDVTEYIQQGDSFGADDVNAITDAINKNDGVPVGAVVTFDGSQLPSGFEPYTTAEQSAIAQINDNLTVQNYTATSATTLATTIDEYIAQANMQDGETRRLHIVYNSSSSWSVEITRVGSDYNGVAFRLTDATSRYSFLKIGGASTVISPFSTTMTIPQLMASHAGAGKDGSLNCSINVTNFKTIKIGTMALNCPYGAIGNIGLSGNASGTLKSASNSTGVTYSNLTYNIANDTKLTFYGYSASVSGNDAYVKFANIELTP